MLSGGISGKKEKRDDYVSFSTFVFVVAAVIYVRTLCLEGGGHHGPPAPGHHRHWVLRPRIQPRQVTALHIRRPKKKSPKSKYKVLELVSRIPLNGKRRYHIS